MLRLVSLSGLELVDQGVSLATALSGRLPKKQAIRVQGVTFTGSPPVCFSDFSIFLTRSWNQRLFPPAAPVPADQRPMPYWS
jgi:hypothetical protein